MRLYLGFRTIKGAKIVLKEHGALKFKFTQFIEKKLINNRR